MRANLILADDRRHVIVDVVDVGVVGQQDRLGLLYLAVHDGLILRLELGQRLKVGVHVAVGGRRAAHRNRYILIRAHAHRADRFQCVVAAAVAVDDSAARNARAG